ncbi:MAG: Tat (twin-arginine translocation) pathway signal sequence domain-containing protein [Thermomicrobium sp.]|nr:Tat (twin-arginine translocation) pathway signal sequence domain-containing protein [Thermomicrobium sp.]
MLDATWNRQAGEPRRHPACPYFRLLVDPEARAISLGQQRFCSAAQQPLTDLAWQAAYCLGSPEQCPYVRRLRGEPADAPGKQLLDLLVERRAPGDRTQREPAPTATARSVTAPRPSLHAGSARTTMRERLAELLRRPLVVAVTTAALIGGLWAGIALADSLGASRPGADTGQRATASPPAFTLRTARATPTPTPYPAPAQLPGVPALSVSRAATPTPTLAPRPTSTPEPTPTVASRETPTATPSPPVPTPPPTPAPAIVWPTATPGQSTEVIAPTPTPMLWPSVSPTPLPTPTPTPAPTPTPTPDPWATLPPMARAGQPVPVATVGNLLATMTPYPFAGNGLAGVAPAGSGPTAEFGLPSNAGVLYGMQSGASSARVWLHTPEPVQRLVLVAEGMSNPGPLAPVLRITINGITLWEGVSPFPRGGWSTVAWVIDKPQILATSQLQITLSLATPGDYGEEPWVALASLTVYAP